MGLQVSMTTCRWVHVTSTASGSGCGIVSTSSMQPSPAAYWLSVLTFIYTALPISAEETCMQLSSIRAEVNFVVFNGTCTSLGCASGTEEGRGGSIRSWRALPGVQYCKFRDARVLKSLDIELTCQPFAVLVAATPSYFDSEIDFQIQVRLLYLRTICMAHFWVTNSSTSPCPSP